HRFASAGSRQNVAEAGAHQAGYSRTETELHELLPHVLHNHVTGSRVESGSFETGLQRARPVTEAAQNFAVHEVMKGHELNNAALSIKATADICHSAHDAPGAKPPAQPFDVSHAVE